MPFFARFAASRWILLLAGLQFGELLRDAVEVDDVVLRQRRDARTRGEDADQVERVASGERDALLALLGDLPHGAQRIDRLGERELLAGEGLRESAAADLAAGFPAPVDLKQLAPGRAARLAGEQVAEDDSVPAQILP